MTIALNEDNSHFFCWHPREEMTVAGLNAWLDQYAGTQVGELLFCPNSQRSNVVSQWRQSVWDGFDPAQGNEQPFFAGMRDFPFPFDWGARAHMRRWVEHAWLVHQQGIDPYALWIARSRSHGISPWLSMRMNDVHYVDEPEHPIHDRFWKAYPEYRRNPEHDPYNGQCLDYGVSEVRTYQLAYVQELLSRYDMDGFELDWMRNPFHFKPGTEEAGCAVRPVRCWIAVPTRSICSISWITFRRAVGVKRTAPLSRRQSIGRCCARSARWTPWPANPAGTWCAHPTPGRPARRGPRGCPAIVPREGASPLPSPPAPQRETGNEDRCASLRNRGRQPAWPPGRSS